MNVTLRPGWAVRGRPRWGQGTGLSQGLERAPGTACRPEGQLGLASGRGDAVAEGTAQRSASSPGVSERDLRASVVVDVRRGTRERRARSDIQIPVLSTGTCSQTPHGPCDGISHPLSSAGPSSVTEPCVICFFSLLNILLRVNVWRQVKARMVGQGSLANGPAQASSVSDCMAWGEGAEGADGGSPAYGEERSFQNTGRWGGLPAGVASNVADDYRNEEPAGKAARARRCWQPWASLDLGRATKWGGGGAEAKEKAVPGPGPPAIRLAQAALAHGASVQGPEHAPASPHRYHR